jgi:hypothetical protein
VGLLEFKDSFAARYFDEAEAVTAKLGLTVTEPVWGCAWAAGAGAGAGSGRDGMGSGSGVGVGVGLGVGLGVGVGVGAEAVPAVVVVPREEDDLDCAVCGCGPDDAPELELLDNPVCGHRVCRPCMAKYCTLGVLSTDFACARCPGNCGEPLTEAVIEASLSEVDMRKYRLWVARKYMETSQHLRECHSPGCETFIEYVVAVALLLR